MTVPAQGFALVLFLEGALLEGENICHGRSMRKWSRAGNLTAESWRTTRHTRRT
jgi:hypothetical protein